MIHETRRQRWAIGTHPVHPAERLFDGSHTTCSDTGDDRGRPTGEVREYGGVTIRLKGSRGLFVGRRDARMFMAFRWKPSTVWRRAIVAIASRLARSVGAELTFEPLVPTRLYGWDDAAKAMADNAELTAKEELRLQNLSRSADERCGAINPGGDEPPGLSEVCFLERNHDGDYHEGPMGDRWSRPGDRRTQEEPSS